ncbi:MAG TPA: hypothetical protein VKU62_09645 [Thermoanaerobaculia bacterium]|nr:hypothetical protein [Thermoanaerobaculia bacterium]
MSTFDELNVLLDAFTESDADGVRLHHLNLAVLKFATCREEFLYRLADPTPAELEGIARCRTRLAMIDLLASRLSDPNETLRRALAALLREQITSLKAEEQPIIGRLVESTNGEALRWTELERKIEASFERVGPTKKKSYV